MEVATAGTTFVKSISLTLTPGDTKNDMIFAIGPAGTGKTYTGVALAVKALKDKQVKRIILTRPAVEAGENLGFLPGDFKEKLDPYMQPLYDALMDMIPQEKLNSHIESGTIKIAPLAYMRGRTLDNANFFAVPDPKKMSPEDMFDKMMEEYPQWVKDIKGKGWLAK